MKKQQAQSGFTAVELLITLFVAAAFLIAAYQLFNFVIRDGGQARAESRAGNVAYDYMRQYASSATNPCIAYSPLLNSPVTVDGISDTMISVTITCPGYSVAAVSKVEVIVTYNNPQQTVKYATYVDGTSGSASNDILSGLIAWWKMNGNADSSVGSYNGTITGATPATGQNGQSNGAYSFNGAGNQVAFSSAPVPTGGSNFTVSAWVNRSRNNAVEEIISQWSNANSGNSFFFGFNSGLVRFTDSWPDVSAGAAASTVGSWILVVGVNDVTNNNAYIYVNGALTATKGSRLSYTGSANLYMSRQGEYAGGAEWFQGSMDDIRVYNRALSLSEVQTLYANGAQ